MHDTVVFIPAFNEEANLPAVLQELGAGLPDVDVLVIDDGSTDATAEVARALGADVLSFGENRGLRAGIAAGYREALERGYAICGRVDADGQHPVAELARLIALVREGVCDVAVGSRFAAAEGRRRRHPRRPHPGQGLPGVPAALPAARLGRARRRGDLAGHPRGHTRGPDQGRPVRAHRGRHHQPA